MKHTEDMSSTFSEAGFYRDMRETNRCIDALIAYAGLDVPDADPSAWHLGDTHEALVASLLKSYSNVSLIKISPYPVPIDVRSEAERMMYDIRYWTAQFNQAGILPPEAQQGFSSKIGDYSEHYNPLWDSLVQHYRDVSRQEIPAATALQHIEHHGAHDSHIKAAHR